MSSSRTEILRTDAVVLKAMDYGETSRIVTLFTRDHGRVGVMARGARSSKSRFGSTLEPMSWIQTVIHFKPGRDLQSLSEASHMELFANIGRSLDRIAAGVRTIELTSALMQSGQSNPIVLELQVEALRLIDQADERIGNVWPFYAMRLAGLLGLSPSFGRPEVDRLPGDGGWLRLDTGGLDAMRPAGVQSMKASRSALRAFAVCTRAPADMVMRMNMNDAVLGEVTRLVESFIQYHVEDAFPRRTARVLGQIGM
ncbi:MAG: DNA repair protein RecO [Rhodothermales bacterium]|nr:DNA repair protein RecO [Rhodothermales bacterium]MBO6778202.1 DNA repair protein RecO [Rhodothermales bacterium]